MYRVSSSGVDDSPRLRFFEVLLELLDSEELESVFRRLSFFLFDRLHRVGTTKIEERTVFLSPQLALAFSPSASDLAAPRVAVLFLSLSFVFQQLCRRAFSCLWNYKMNVSQNQCTYQSLIFTNAFFFSPRSLYAKLTS